MTTPGGVPNLPMGALTVSTLAQQLQNQSTQAWRQRSADRFPTLFTQSNGGDPLNDLSPFGVITRLFSGVTSLIANADPADITGPADIPDLLTDFIRELPVVGELVGLLDAILGKYTGTDDTLKAIQEIFAPIRKLVQLISGKDVGFPTWEEVARGWEQLHDATLAKISAVLQGMWTGTGGLGDWIVGTLDPEAAKRAMEETQKRIAAAIAQIIGIGGTVVNLAEVPPPGLQLPGWNRTRLVDHGGSLIVRDGLLRIVDDVGFGGTRWRAIYSDKVAAGPDVRVDAVFGTVPGALSGAQNRIVAKFDPSTTDHLFANLMNGKSEIGVSVGGRESVLKTSLGFKFTPAVPYSLIATGSQVRLLRDGSQVGDPAVDSRVAALPGRNIGGEWFTPLTLDPAGGLAAIGFRTPAAQTF